MCDGMPYYGVLLATNYCRTHQRPAIVFTFDQVPWLRFNWMRPENVITNLFTDGGVGMLIIQLGTDTRSLDSDHRY